MKRPLAVVALVVLSWSNATAFQCAASTLPVGTQPAAQSHEHGGHAHAPAPSRVAHDHGGQDTSQNQGDSTQHERSTDCSIVMACGAALGTRMASEPTRPERRQRIAVPVVATPSTADVSQDPPPPRRSA